ncbi:MAG TPA: hypothetical protein VEY09_11355 [Pyrinomonadaceae bacterium]|nr:hypothetical protein [Pyrinomonadaceae bacterium]
MSPLRTLFTFTLCLAAFAPAAAQQSPARAKKPEPAAAQATAETDPEEEMRRATVISLVNNLADEARMFRDATLRARVQARAADALWETEPGRARALFRRAWGEAQAADDENERKLEEEKKKQLRERGSFSFSLPPSLRTEVLRLAARRDHKLGEEFLALMDRARKEEEEDATRPSASDAARPETAPRRRDPVEATPAVEKRLRLALQLMNDGDTARALQFADPALGQVSGTALQFLTRLRAKDAQAADSRYAVLLARAIADPSSDANTASLLSSYLFSPTLYITFSHEGASSGNGWGDGFPAPADVSPLLRARFFEAAASILLRPLPPPEQDRTSSGRNGAYMVIARLLPLFDQWAADKSPALRARQAALTAETTTGARDSRNQSLTAGLVPEDQQARDRVADALERLKRARTTDERDAIYVQAAFSAMQQKDPRAEEFISKIEDSDLRGRVRAYADYERTQEAVRAEDWQEVLRLARGGNLSPIQKAWALTEAARLAAKDEPGRAVEILDEALVEAKERIDAASPERPSALVAIATQMLKLDRPRAWEVTLDAIKASNSAQGYTGEDGRLFSRLETKNMTMMTTSGAESFDLAGLFAEFAREDLTRAVGLVRNLEGEGPRAAATLALARTVLQKK